MERFALALPAQSPKRILGNLVQESKSYPAIYFSMWLVQISVCFGIIASPS
jgi:hypothetical protein